MKPFTTNKGLLAVFAMTVIAAGGISCAKAEQSESVEIQQEVENDISSQVSSEPTWSDYLTIPDKERMASLAVSPPIAQGDSKITVIAAPAGFDSAAYVENSGSVGIYLIANIAETEEALERASEIENEISEKLSLSRLESEANNAISASSFVPSAETDLSLVNVIVAPDMIAGNTVTLAFTYSE